MALTTTPEIKALKPKADRYDVAVASENEDGRQIPGLQIRVFPSGVKVGQYRYALNGSVRRMSLGPFPAVGLKELREKHQAAARLVARGVDPQEHAAQQAEIAAKEKARKDAEITIDRLVDEFIENHLREHRKDPGQAERMLKVDVLPTWRGRKAGTLTRRDAVLLLRGVKKRAPVLANRVAALIVQLFGFAVDEGHLEANPMAGLKRPTKETARGRKLDIEEIKTLWKVLDERSAAATNGEKLDEDDQPRLSRGLAIGIKLLLVTAQRRGELMKSKWSDFDFDGKLWVIPKEHSKNGKEHVVPLSTLAIELLEEARALENDSAYLFVTAQNKRRGDVPVTDKALTRAAARNQCGIDKWVPHDLRRSAASHMNRLGVDAIVVEKVLNHSLPKMMETYNRHDYETEKRNALDRWSAELRRIIAGESNVVALPAQRASA